MVYFFGMPTAEEAYTKHLNRVEVTAKGKVQKILEDDITGAPHQRFIVELHSGHTLLVLNNLEFGYRVPVKVNDTVEVRGSFVWSKYGGLVHQTHHDERKVHADGYIILVKEPKEKSSLYQ